MSAYTHTLPFYHFQHPEFGSTLETSMEYESGSSMQQLLRYIAHEYINKIYQSIKKEKKRMKKVRSVT